MKKKLLLLTFLLLCGMLPLLAQATDGKDTLPLHYVDAKNKLAMTGVGYPKVDASERIALAEAISRVENATAVTQEDLDAVSTALAAYEACTDVLLPEDGKVYRISGRMQDGSLFQIYRSGINGKCSATPVIGNEGMLIAQRYAPLVPQGDGYYRLVSAEADAWWTQGAGFNTTTQATMKFDRGVNFGTLRMMGYYLDGTTPKWRTYVVRYTGSAYMLDYYSRAAGSEYSNVSALETSDFVFEEVEGDWCFPATVHDGSNGDYGTLHLPFASIVPEGVTAYALRLNETDNQWLDQIETITPGGILPAETPVLLQGEAPGIYKFRPSAAQGLSPLATGLKGTLGSTRIDETAYIMAFESGVGSEIMFYLLNNADRVVGSNKAYWVPVQTASAVQFRLGKGTPTGINSDMWQQLPAGTPIYTLDGRRVTDPTLTGIYVVGGRKIIVK